MSADEQRTAIYETWETMAPGWERWADEIEGTLAPAREWLIAALAPSAGDRVLEIAAGPGDTGLAAAPLVGEGGRIISTDLVPAMVEIARRRSEALGVTNVEHRVMDAERLELEDDSVDGVLCRFGYMLVPDCGAALAEARRVLRPGGRLALAVWRGAEQNPWISIAGRMLVERGHMPRPEPGQPGIFALADEERLRGLLEAAGSRSFASRTSTCASSTRTSRPTSCGPRTRAASSRGSGPRRPRTSGRRSGRSSRPGSRRTGSTGATSSPASRSAPSRADA